MNKKIIGLLKRPSKKAARIVAALLLWGMFVPGAIVAPREAGAQYNTPTLGDGSYLSPSDAPCIPFEVGPSTGTTEAAIVGAATGSKTQGWVNWVAVSTGSFDSYLILKDTGAVSNSGINSLTGRVMYSSGPAVNGTNVYPEYQVYNYRPAALFQNGLTVKVTGCTGGCFATVCYRKMNTQYP